MSTATATHPQSAVHAERPTTRWSFRSSSQPADEMSRSGPPSGDGAGAEPEAPPLEQSRRDTFVEEGG
jgi:hypothetical protein